jgi:peptidoglycan/LPS O-acetylase OafA/YrhL
MAVHANDERVLRTNNFDFLRLALAVLVIFSHSFPLAAGSEIREPLRMLTRGQMTCGALAVDLFFIMSGFLITASAERSSSILSFLKKRVQRIYPAFVVSALIMLLVVAPLAGAKYDSSAIVRLGDFLLQTLRLREFHYTSAFAANPYPNAINGSVWSIQYEFWCYIGVALLPSVGLLRKRAAVLTLFLVSVAVSVAFQVKGWVLGGKFLGVLLGSPQLWARLLPLYLAGVVFYLYRDRIRLTAVGCTAAVAALSAACWISSGWTALFPFAGTYIVFAIAFARWLPLQNAGRFGDFSYGTYLYAFPIEQLLVQAFGHTLTPTLLFLCATPCTLAAAVLSWYGVERHLLRRGRRKHSVMRKPEAERSARKYLSGQIAAISTGRTEA